MKSFFEFDSALSSLCDEVLEECREAFERTAEITAYNQQRVLKAFIDNGISESHFAPSTGYGYGDRGRDALERVFADCMECDSALIRHNFVSGTHALTVMLFGILRPGDEMLCLTGRPYDTLIGVLGIDGFSDGSLADFGIKYSEVELDACGKPDIPEILKQLAEKRPRVAYIQRSRGYSLRPSLTAAEIKELAAAVKSASPETVVMLDNCYGEFTEYETPSACGVDIMAGSLIKNPGGGIAPTGGYICGKGALVEKCAYRLTAPGVGAEVGATLGHTRELFMGLFNAPHVVGEAVKTAIFASALFKRLGFEVTPEPQEARADIIQCIKLKNSRNLEEFCKGLQSGAPIDANVVPEAWDMPGYDSKVIMAAGAFTGGSSIELSADAPLREPFAVWMQGGLNFDSAKIGVMKAAQNMLGTGLISLG